MKHFLKVLSSTQSHSQRTAGHVEKLELPNNRKGGGNEAGRVFRLFELFDRGLCAREPEQRHQSERNHVCQTQHRDHARNRGVEHFRVMGVDAVRSISPSIRQRLRHAKRSGNSTMTSSAEPLRSEAIHRDGKRRGRPSSGAIRCASVAKQTGDSRRRLWLTTLSHTKATRRSFGIRGTGSRCASLVMTPRRAWKTGVRGAFFRGEGGGEISTAYGTRPLVYRHLFTCGGFGGGGRILKIYLMKGQWQ